MRKKIFFILALLIVIGNAGAQTGIESQLNYFSSQNNLNIIFSFENKNQEAYATLENNLLKISKGGKELALDLESFRSNKLVVGSMDSDFRPNKIILSADENPKISFLKDKEEIFSVTQTANGMTKIFFRIPADEKEDIPSLFIVEHYTPDKEILDITRAQGKSRLTIIAKNNPSVEINNNGLYVLPESLSISTRSFFNAELEKSELDILEQEKIQAKELIGFTDSLVLRMSSFSFDSLFDRGYKTEKIDVTSEKKITGFDVTPELCSKLGFVFLPGYGYDFIKATDDFTNHKGWVLGIAYSKENDLNTSLEDMLLFIEEAYENSLTPIVRIDSEKIDAALVSDFINALYNISEGKLEYVQLGDKPNSRDMTPKGYTDFVSDAKRNIDPSIKIISAAIMPDKDSKNYFSSLVALSRFSESIDYLGAYAYNMNISGEDCITGKELYEEKLCMDDFTNYKLQLELLKKKTGKSFEAIITEAGYPPEDANFRKTQVLLQSFKEDKNVKAALIHVANSWKESPEKSWLNEDATMKGFAEKVSGEVCG